MISLYDILEASNGQLFGEPAAHIFTDFCLDSRIAKEGDLYVALKTDRGDTHQYIREAVEKGALGILCTQPPDIDTDGLSVVMVKDTETALMAWARDMLGKLGMQIIGVTGSSGKSLTVEVVSRLLSSKYSVHRSSGNLNGPLGLPLALSHLTPDHQFVVLELGANAPGEMAEMVQNVHPDVGIVTNIGQAHMDTFASLDEIIREKRRLVEYLSPSGLAVLNYDDDNVREMAAATRARVTTVGMERFGCDLMAYNVVAGLTKTGFDLRHGSERVVGRWTPLLGKHQLYSILIALAVGLYYDVGSLEDMLKLLTELPYLPGRMRPFEGINGSLIIDDTYSATPQSALAALNWVQAVNDGNPLEERRRIIFVLGDLDRLGAQSQLGHRSVGQRAAAVADVIVTTGQEAALTGRAALDQGMDPARVGTTYGIQDAIAVLKNQYVLTANDVVLVEGGPAARMELVVRALLKNPKDEAELPRKDMPASEVALFQPTRLTWIEIDQDALAYNVRAIKEFIGHHVALMAVVKANAYGHGAVAAARTSLLNGAEYLAVASLHEALELREAGIEAPILVMSYVPVYAIREAIRQRITVTIYDLDLARAYDRAARDLGSKLYVHAKVDTGMGRLGVLAADSLAFFRHLVNLSSLELEGIYTHFSCADSSPDYTAEQVRVFKDVLRPLRASGFNFAYIHAANSAGMLASKDNHFNMVRVGLALYGYSPAAHLELPQGCRPVMTWKTVVAQVKTLPAGHPVGYGNTYVTRAEEQVAIIPVGYADGFRRAPGNWGEVLLHGRRVPLLGRVSMEKTIINVTDIPGVAVGDEVVLLGRQGDETITADDVAARLNTISYEVLTGILPDKR